MGVRTILAATDFSDRSFAAVAAAREVAEAVEAQRIHLVHVLDTGLGGSPLPYTLPEAEAEEVRAEAMARAEERLRAIEVLPGIERTVEVRIGEPAYELAVTADEVGAECIVVATQGRGAIGRAVLGSVTCSLIGMAHCPVLVTGKERGALHQLKRLLAAVDMSPVSYAVLRAARGLVRRTKGELRVFSVYQRPFMMPAEHPMYFTSTNDVLEIEAEQAQKQALDELISQTLPGLHVATDVVSGFDPAERVSQYAEDHPADLMIIGSSGIRTWGRRLFGTNAERVLAKAKVPVLVIPDPTRRGVEVETHLVKNETGKKRHPDEQMVYALFDDEPSVRRVLAELVNAGVTAEDISVLMSEGTHRDKFDNDHPDEAFAAGGAVGATVGGILGGLASLGAASGVGLLVVGPAVALGLAGGLLGTLLGFGVPSSEAKRLESEVKDGKTLVAVHTHDFAEIQRSKDILASMGAMPKRLAL
ncbi:MAG: universal stress protein [Myxococcota bacterium]